MPRSRVRAAQRASPAVDRAAAGTPTRSDTAGLSVGAYLIRRLQDYGVRHVFGIPGDYVLRFYELLSQSQLTLVGTAQEDGAGFAADAYARVAGIGCVCVTYCVGGLSVANAVAGAYAEKSPVVVITGAPGMNERLNDPLLHHKVRTFSTQKEIFAHITCAAVVLDEAQSAFQRIDEALRACWTRKRPVYIELPRDLVDCVPRLPYTSAPEPALPRDDAALTEAISEAVAMLGRAQRPMILADVELHRYGLAIELTQLAERSGIPVAVTILGKSVISELHPNFVGVYEGAMGRPEVREQVEQADCLLMLGTLLTDVNLGVFTAQLDRARTIEATSEKVQVRHHRWDGIDLGDFLRALTRAELPQRRLPPPPARPSIAPARPVPLQAERLFQLLNARLDEGMAVVCDVGLCLFGAIDLVIADKTTFIAPAYYTSMGFAVPGALGLGIANRELRPIVLVGDGAFQMTGPELSAIALAKLDPIVLVLNNRGYTTERFIQDGPFNDILEWRFEQMPQLLGVGWGTAVGTEQEFAQAWDRAVAHRGSYSLLNCRLAPLDGVPALRRLGEQMAVQLCPPTEAATTARRPATRPRPRRQGRA